MATDILSADELAELKEVNTILVEGHPYMWIMDFGWAKIGYYVKHLTPNRFLVAHCNHFRNGGKDYGRLMTEGADETCEWRYEGKLVELNALHVLQVSPYSGTVNRTTRLPETE